MSEETRVLLGLPKPSTFTCTQSEYCTPGAYPAVRQTSHPVTLFHVPT